MSASLLKSLMEVNVAADTRKAALRARMRAEGMKQLEVWLPAAMVEKIDDIKRSGYPSRDAVLMSLIANTIEEKKPGRSRDQLALL